jgi:hypothetical protein
MTTFMEYRALPPMGCEKTISLQIWTYSCSGEVHAEGHSKYYFFKYFVFAVCSDRLDLFFIERGLLAEQEIGDREIRGGVVQL